MQRSSSLKYSSKLFYALLIIAAAISFVIIYKNFMTKSEAQAPESQDAYNAAYLALSATSSKDFPQLKTHSRNQELFTGMVLGKDTYVIKSDGDLQSGLAEEQISQIASITKTFTAATLAKMVTDEKYKSFFDSEDPIGTPISKFEGLIEKYGSENQKKYFATLKGVHPNYSGITLRHLLNHSSGIKDNFSWDEFRENQASSYHLSDRYTDPVVVKEGFGRFQYSDDAYNNLLAPIMEAVAVASEDLGAPVKFSELVRRQIIEPLGLTRTFAADQMRYDAATNLVFVGGNPDIRVAQGYDYFNGKVTSGQDFNYDTAAGGVYSTAKEVSKFYKALLDGTLLGEGAREVFFDERNFINSDDPRNTPDKTFEGYGLGIRKISGGEIEYFHHGGAGLGFYSHVIGQRNVSNGDVKVATTLLAYENLTRPIATALLGDEKKDGKGNYFVDAALEKKMFELNQLHSQSDLIAMRFELDSIKGSFLEKSESFTKSYTEKYTPSAHASSVSATALVGDERGQVGGAVVR